MHSVRSRSIFTIALLLSAANIPVHAESLATTASLAAEQPTTSAVQLKKAKAKNGKEHFDEAFASAALDDPRLTIEAAKWAMSAYSVATTAFGWDGSAKGSGVIIGIVDSGIDLDHREFAGRVLPGTCLGGSICGVAAAMLGGDPGVYSKQTTHGTHVAGIAAGATVGMAPGAQILPVKVCDTYTASCPGDVDGGVVWASTHGAKVINVSIGGPGLYQGDIVAAQRAIANGAVLAVAAGNAGKTHPVSGFFGGAALTDGVRGAMIVVGATGLNNQISGFSQTPGSTCELHGGVNYCMRDYFVVAPGQGIKSSVGGGKYATMSGTSMSTPYVSGVAALIKGQWPSLTPFQVVDIIFKTAKDLGAAGPDKVYGRGAVDVAAAMAPVGGDAVIAATGGTSLSNASGSAGALTTASFGVLSAGLSGSKLLKNVVVVDSYGRDFDADLSRRALAPGLSLAGLIRDPFHSMAPFALSQTNSAGTLSLAGTIVAADLPAAAGANAALEAEAAESAPHVAVSFAPEPALHLDFAQGLAAGGAFNPFDVRADRSANPLFLSASALNSPYSSLADGGAYSGARFSPMKNVTLRFGYAAAHEKRPSEGIALPRKDARAVMAGAAWDFASWGGVALTASRAAEDDGVLGGIATGAFAAVDRADTSSIGVSARARLAAGWTATVAWNEGLTHLDLAQGGLITAADPIRSRAYGFALSKQAIFGNDALGIAVTRPLYIYGGAATLHAATGVDAAQNLIFGDEHLSLAAPRPETDVELGYSARLLGGSLTLQTNAAYQLDVSGQPGKSAVAVLSRASVNF